MTRNATPETLALFAQFVARNIGLSFPSDRLHDLEQKMATLGRQAGYADIDKYLLWLMSAPLSQGHLEVLARTLTIGETYFLRDPKSYQILEQHLLPELIAARRNTDKTLRIWSAGCSSGEEPYSIAILLDRAIPDLADWKITLLGTDINPQALERARRGVYSQWSFRNAPPWLMDYFSKREDRRFEIVPRIRKMVRFSHLNLADERISEAVKGTDQVDVIFCRNVMLYFDAALIEKTMARFHAALKDSGWLFVGPTEVDHHAYRGFSCRHFEGALVLRKVAGELGASGGHAHHATLQHGQHGEHARPSAVPAEREAPPFRMQHPAAAALLPSAEPGPAPALAPSSPERSEAEANQPPGPSGFALALAHYDAGRYQQAADQALQSLAAPGEDQAGVLALGARAYANIGRFDEARECCEKAIACDRLRAANHYLLSIILEQQGDTAGAVQSLKHALFIDHDYLLAYFALGNLSRQLGEHKESQRNFANALRLLEKRDPHEVLAEAEGMTAGRLAQMILAMMREKQRSGDDR